MQLQNYIITCQKHIFMNTMIYQMQKEHKWGTQLFLEACNYDDWFKNKESTDTTSRKSDKEEYLGLSDMPPLEGNEEVKEGEG